MLFVLKDREISLWSRLINLGNLSSFWAAQAVWRYIHQLSSRHLGNLEQIFGEKASAWFTSACKLCPSRSAFRRYSRLSEILNVLRALQGNWNHKFRILEISDLSPIVISVYVSTVWPRNSLELSNCPTGSFLPGVQLFETLGTFVWVTSITWGGSSRGIVNVIWYSYNGGHLG